jgi:hypothetical protein
MPETDKSVPVGDSLDCQTKRKPSKLLSFLASSRTTFAFGIVGPIVCFGVKWSMSADLNWLPGLGLVCENPVFGYGIIGLEMAILTLWLWRGDCLGRLTGIVAGVLYFGAAFAGVLGLVMLPYSLMGAMIGIGLLGFVPLLTSMVFLVQGLRAASTSKRLLGDKRTTTSGLLGSVLIGVPAAIYILLSLIADQSAKQTVETVAQGKLATTTGFQRWCLFMHPDRLVIAYRVESSADRRKNLASSYNELTGADIEARIHQLDD